MKKTLTQTIALAALLGATFALTGCASDSGLLADKEHIVEQRAQERWNHLLAGDYNKAYAYLPPSYRALVTAEDYRNRFGDGAAWKSAVVERVKCETDERCAADIDLRILVVARGFSGKPLPAKVYETWLKEDGQWWFYQKN
jgi:hypothetical protein